MADASPDALPDTGPVPLSFPAILRNPTLSDRFAHLHDPPSHQRSARKDRPEPEGKRWVRRRENGALHRSRSPPRLTHPQPDSYTTHTSPSRPAPTLPIRCRSPRPRFRTPCLPTYPAPCSSRHLALLPLSPTHPQLASSPSPCVAPAVPFAPALPPPTL